MNYGLTPAELRAGKPIIVPLSRVDSTCLLKACDVSGGLKTRKSTVNTRPSANRDRREQASRPHLSGRP
jgi:hypothetical protein